MYSFCSITLEAEKKNTFLWWWWPSWIFSQHKKDENVISGIALISDAQSQKIEKQGIEKSVRARKPKMLNNYLR
jgi:hypothetical protein